MIFNPEESIDFHGFTGPFVQYTYARIRSILRKATAAGSDTAIPLSPLERNLIRELEKFPQRIGEACQEMNPSVIAKKMKLASVR